MQFEMVTILTEKPIIISGLFEWNSTPGYFHCDFNWMILKSIITITFLFIHKF